MRHGNHRQTNRKGNIMKIKIEGHVHWLKRSWQPEGSFGFANHPMGNISDYTDVCEATVEVEVPDNFDPREAQVESLLRQKQALMAEFQTRCTEIERQISKLTALEAV